MEAKWKYGWTRNAIGQWVWGIALTLFLTHQFLEKGLRLRFMWLDGYLDPFLFPILVFPLLLAQYRWAIQETRLVFPKLGVLGLWILFSMVAEGLFPWLSPTFTADIWDVLVMGFGTLVFFRVFNQSGPINRTPKADPV